MMRCSSNADVAIEPIRSFWTPRFEAHPSVSLPLLLPHTLSSDWTLERVGSGVGGLTEVTCVVIVL